MKHSDGGSRVARVLARHGTPFLFTLVGGHISPILVACKREGIDVVDVRDEATAVFAADAVARLTGAPGVAAVTAGPGLTNTITAVKNAQLAQSPVLVLGGATATILKGRGALQDIDQVALMRPHVKRAFVVRRVRDLERTVEKALEIARSGVPGPTFVECPVDLLYPEELVRGWYAKDLGGKPTSWSQRVQSWYVNHHLDRVFTPDRVGGTRSTPEGIEIAEPSTSTTNRAASTLRRAERPVLLVGSQAMSRPEMIPDLVDAVNTLDIPVFLTGMARGLLGRSHPLQLRRARRKALSLADVVILAGVPCDFRLSYGMHISRRATLVAANSSLGELLRNRRPDLGVVAHPAGFLIALARQSAKSERREPAWLDELRQRESARVPECLSSCGLVDTIHLFEELERVLPDDSVLVADGGDFVATGSYILRPRRPLSWLDPGVFGTLGVGAGFGLGARLCRPEAEVWLLYGDGSLGYSLIEFDTFARRGLPVIALVGNDASWAQIAREQVPILGDDVATVLDRTAYHEAAKGLGGEGLIIEDNDQVQPVIEEARSLARAGKPVLINAMISTTDARQGSLSI